MSPARMTKACSLMMAVYELREVQRDPHMSRVFCFPRLREAAHTCTSRVKRNTPESLCAYSAAMNANGLFTQYRTLPSWRQ